MALITYKPVETTKAHERRVREGFFQYAEGVGIDIGCGNDPLFTPFLPDGQPGNELDCKRWGEAEPVAPRLFIWDLIHGDGDAHEMEGIPPETFDYVHSSHLLEHLEDPVRALRRWFELLKPGGYLLLLVPHRDRYENRRLLPSKWNGDHKSFWLPEEHDPPHTWGLKKVMELAFDTDFIGFRNDSAQLEYIKICDEGWKPVLDGEHAGGEYSIEVVIRKYDPR